MRFNRNDPLNQEDTLEQTKGCRYTPPSICKRIDMPNICAFVRPDNLCVKPPIFWAKQFKVLHNQG